MLSGETPGFAGDAAAGDASGLADWTGLGLTAGLFGMGASEVQAPITAVETAKADTNISLLIFLLLRSKTERMPFLHRHPSQHGTGLTRLSALPQIRRMPLQNRTLRLGGTSGREKLAEKFTWRRNKIEWLGRRL